MNIELLLGLATTGAQTAQPSPLLQFLPIILILFVFYFLVIRPQQKEQKKREEFVDNLKAGVKVLVSGGILGKISHVEKNTCTVEIGNNNRVKVLRNQILEAPKFDAEEAKAKKN